MPNTIFHHVADAIARGEVSEDDFAGGYSIFVVEPPNGPGEYFEVENPDYPYISTYQVLHKVPGIAGYIWSRVGRIEGETLWLKRPRHRFFCRLVDMRRTD